MSAGKILIVEDTAAVRTVLKLQLEGEGYEVATAQDGIEGLERVDEDPPDLILLDVMMPRMDGWEVCRRLKSGFATNQIPIIMLTARGQTKDKVTGLQIGANDYLTKPYSRQELLARVRNMLLWSRAQREANPLTGLPGNAAIDAEARERIESGEPFAFLYIDIDNFKAYNDYYSYQRGDEAIKLTASIILHAVGSRGGERDFVGHIGGDDFIVLSTPDHAREVAEEIKREFDEKIPELYSPADRSRGFIEVVNRQNVLTVIPLMTVTVAGVTNVGRSITHVGQLSNMAGELKRYGKSCAGSIVVWERRGD